MTNMALGNIAKAMIRPTPKPTNVPSARTATLKDMRQPSRKRYSTSLSEAAARAAVERL